MSLVYNIVQFCVSDNKSIVYFDCASDQSEFKCSMHDINTSKVPSCMDDTYILLRINYWHGIIATIIHNLRNIAASNSVTQWH